MSAKWSWGEGFRFALARELLPKEGSSYKKNGAERFGSCVLRPLYRMIELVSKHIRKPLAICFITLFAALFAALVFYNIPALTILGKIFPSKAARFLLFLYLELNLFALGCHAFGRFQNAALVNLWKRGEIFPVFPGDKNQSPN